MNKQTQKRSLQLMIAGAMTAVTLNENGFKPCHGIGLDGKTPVKSLEIGTSPDHSGNIFVKDVHGNAITTTADELFVAAQHAARDSGYDITAVKIE